MIKYLEGDLFKSPAQVIVNTVNTVGVMGKGIALEYKNRYPNMFEKYREYCDKKKIQIGKLMLWYEPDHWILLFPTKEHWRNPSKLRYIEEGLVKFVNTYADKNIVSIAFPRLGCGNGELNWDEVKPLMEKYLKPLPIDVYIYLKNEDSQEEPEHKNQKATIQWLRSNAKDMSFTGIKDDIINSKQDLFTSHQFKYQEHEWLVDWKDQCIFTRNDSAEIIKVSEDTFLEIWDEIRELAIFPRTTADREFNIVCALLNSLGYLSKIKIQDPKDLNMIEGYQLNEGIGRTFALTES
jgi:O-acetyl-ADP-ribose deacetylase (regulator of RNase III)